MKRSDINLYLVTDEHITTGKPFEIIVEEAVKGGVTMVQLREKQCCTRDFLKRAFQMKAILQKYGVPLIINDRLDIALAVNADGLHIGKSDIPYQTARRLFGKDKIIGLSIETIDEAQDANLLDVDYIAISPVFNTPTKTDTKKPFGIEGVRAVAAITKHPAVAIGGINSSNAKDIMAAGADGIAVVSAIMAADDPCMAAMELKKQINIHDK